MVKDIITCVMLMFGHGSNASLKAPRWRRIAWRRERSFEFCGGKNHRLLSVRRFSAVFELMLSRTMPIFLQWTEEIHFCNLGVLRSSPVANSLATKLSATLGVPFR